MRLSETCRIFGEEDFLAILLIQYWHRPVSIGHLFIGWSSCYLHQSHLGCIPKQHLNHAMYGYFRNHDSLKADIVGKKQSMCRVNPCLSLTVSYFHIRSDVSFHHQNGRSFYFHELNL